MYTRNCVADNILIKPLHTSDHYFIALTYILLPPSHQHLYQLPLDETFFPFHPHIFPLSLSYPFLSSGCERCNWLFVLHFNFLSRPYMSSRPVRAAPSNP